MISVRSKKGRDCERTLTGSRFTSLTTGALLLLHRLLFFTISTGQRCISLDAECEAGTNERVHYRMNLYQLKASSETVQL